MEDQQRAARAWISIQKITKESYAFELGLEHEWLDATGIAAQTPVAITQRHLAKQLRMGDIQAILMAKTDVDYVFLVVHDPNYVVCRGIGICLADKGSSNKWVSN
jgi:hypothetical protein